MNKNILLVIIAAILLSALITGTYFAYHYFKFKDIKRLEWTDVRRAFEDCNVSAVDQTHGKTVYLNLKDGTKVYAYEPQKNSVIDLLVNSMTKCGQIDLKTD